MRKFALSVSATILLRAAVGCSDDTETTGGSGGSDASQTSSDATSTSSSPGSGGDDAGSGGSGGDDAGSGGSGGKGGQGTGSGGNGGAPAESPFNGRVLFANDLFLAGDDLALSGSVSASFSETIEPASPDGCVETTQGDCTLIECPPFEGESAVQEPRQAGDFTIEGTTVAAELVYDEAGYYSFYYGGNVIYEAGDELSVTTTGDDVPAFSATVVAGGHAIVTTPTASNLSYSRDEAMDFVWTVEGSGGRLLAYLSTYQEDGTSAAIYCDWPMEDGEASMPAAIMGALPATTDASLSLYDYATVATSAGDWNIEVATQGTPAADTESGAANFNGIILE